jgi:predicted O-methyltransferase YrrM
MRAELDPGSVESLKSKSEIASVQASTMTILERILADKVFEDNQGNMLPLLGEIPTEEGERISACIRRHSFSRTLEIGCACGISSLYICDAICQQSNPHHIIIDPFQASDFRNVGIRHLKDAGFSCWELIEQVSELALPGLLQSGVTVQFALIDGYHTFDQVLVDFFYIDRLLEDGGIVVFDDVQMPAIDKVVRYVSRYPNYRLYEKANRLPLPKSLKHRLFELILKLLTQLLPAHNREEYFDDRWLRPATEVGSGSGSRFVMLQKSGPAFSQEFLTCPGEVKWRITGFI